MRILNSLAVQIAFKRGVTWPVVRLLPGTRGSMTVMINDSQVRSVYGVRASSQHHPKQECGHTYPMQKSFYKLEDFCRDNNVLKLSVLLVKRNENQALSCPCREKRIKFEFWLSYTFCPVGKITF